MNCRQPPQGEMNWSFRSLQVKQANHRVWGNIAAFHSSEFAVKEMKWWSLEPVYLKVSKSQISLTFQCWGTIELLPDKSNCNIFTIFANVMLLHYSVTKRKLGIYSSEWSSNRLFGNTGQQCCGLYVGKHRISCSLKWQTHNSGMHLQMQPRSNWGQDVIESADNMNITSMTCTVWTWSKLTSHIPQGDNNPPCPSTSPWNN